MSDAKKLGIWMDHSSAHLTEFSAEPVESKIITSDFSHQDKENSLGKGENLMHHKEQHKHAQYYKQLGEEIRKYDEVLLFGPTDAKTELLNVLKADHLFSKIKFDVKQTDKMSEYHQHAFVNGHFNKEKTV